jgi:hypothetical protein
MVLISLNAQAGEDAKFAAAALCRQNKASSRPCLELPQPLE